MADRPSIEVMVTRGNADHPLLKQVLYGIEEEQVPVKISEVGDGAAAEIAYMAAEVSRLEVGIGMDATGNFCLHHKKLKKDQPYLTLSRRSELETARVFGNNSARLVKRMPLRKG